MLALRNFLERLRSAPRVVIQAHDFPDHDAVASAFALSHLLHTQQMETLLVYNGIIDRISLQNMIETLQIPIVHHSQTDINPKDIIITVDGCIGEKNVSDLPGTEIAVIDHHQVTPPGNLWYQDVRPHYGSTASIIWEYFQYLEQPIPARECTALQVGLAVDTANLTRGFGQPDIDAFAYLHQHADQHLVGKITRNSLQQNELIYYQQVLDVLEIHNGVAFAWLEQGCPKNMLGILGDFLLSLEEVDLVILAATTGHSIQLSLRSECTQTSAEQLVKRTLQGNGIGFGGGHAHMAGGIISQGKWHGSHNAASLKALFFPETADCRYQA